eukprot:GFYU01025446.1.p1 GENE.GFYU01025446.1~~GFYU01025446.1.p1  ORF type:complete len:295 (-),score=72.31 GFYU01025446.1:86-970(-)
MSTSRAPGRGGVASVAAKMKKKMEVGDYYEAQQMYRTLYFRYNGQKKFEDCDALLQGGILQFLECKQGSCAMDLVKLLFTTHETMKCPYSQSLDAIKKIDQGYESGQCATADRIAFLKYSIKWTAQHGQWKSGEPTLHLQIAKLYESIEEYGSAQPHYLKGNDPKSCAKMLSVWATKTYPSEADLVLTRAVLQYLCLTNLKDANIIFDSVENSMPNKNAPILNFVRYLLLTLERDAYPLFSKLRDVYSTSLQRDPTFFQYLDHIAKVFFGVQPQTGMAGIFGDIMKSFMGGGDE